MFNKHEAGYLKRDTSFPKGRQVEASSVAKVRHLIGDLEPRRDLLIEAFHKIQDEVGHLPADHLSALAEIFKLSQAEVFEVASFYHHFDIVREEENPPPGITIRVCDSVSCMLAGANQLVASLEKMLTAEVCEFVGSHA